MTCFDLLAAWCTLLKGPPFASLGHRTIVPGQRAKSRSHKGFVNLILWVMIAPPTRTRQQMLLSPNEEARKYHKYMRKKRLKTVKAQNSVGKPQLSIRKSGFPRFLSLLMFISLQQAFRCLWPS